MECTGQSCRQDLQREQFVLRRRVRCVRQLLTVGFAVTLSVSAFADDPNPFGLPQNSNSTTHGSVMLHGGGNGLARDKDGVMDSEMADAIREKFLQLARIGKKKARIVFIPSEKQGNENQRDYEEQLKDDYWQWYRFRERTDEVESFDWFYPDQDGCPHEDCQHLDLLEKATGVWMTAGDQESLPELYAAEYPQSTSRFQKGLRRVVENGGVVGGLGGAASSLSETVINGNDDSSGGWARARLRFGLALFDGAIVDQNFDSHAGRLERMTNLLRSGPRLNRFEETPGVERRTIGLGLERYTVMILKQNTVEVIGKRRGHIFLKGNGDRTVLWKTLSNNESLTLRTGSDSQLVAGPKLIDSQNPFGMPTPAHANLWGQVVLHGGKTTDELRQFYPQLAASHPDLAAHPGRHPRLVHCPAADQGDLLSAIQGKETLEIRRARHDQHLRTSYAVWADMAPKVFERVDFAAPDDIEDQTSRNDPKFVTPLKKAHAVWFSGGNQRNLTKLFGHAAKPSEFQQGVIDVVRQGGVVGGSSAGLAVMPTIMISSQSGDEWAPKSADLDFGFGVLKNVFAEQHFDARTGRIERLTAQLRNPVWPKGYAHPPQPEQMIGIAVDEETALVIRNNRVRVIGERTAHIFLLARDRNTVTWHALKSGESAVIQENGQHEYVLDVENWRFD